MNETDSMLDQLGGVESSVPPLPGCYRTRPCAPA
jgi:hypothetical protein